MILPISNSQVAGIIGTRHYAQSYKRHFCSCGSQNVLAWTSLSSTYLLTFPLGGHRIPPIQHSKRELSIFPKLFPHLGKCHPHDRLSVILSHLRDKSFLLTPNRMQPGSPPPLPSLVSGTGMARCGLPLCLE
jgi:hypothetical protein